MKRIRAVSAIIISGLLITGASGCDLISKTQSAKEKEAVAVVNGTKITKADYQKELAQVEAQYKQTYGTEIFSQSAEALTQAKTDAYNQLVGQRVLLDKAKQLKITVSDKDIQAEADKQIKADIKSAGGQKKYLEYLKKAKYTEASFKDALIADFKVNLPIQKLYDSVVGGLKVTDTEVSNEYTANPYKYTEKTDTMNVSHILLKTEAEAKNVLALIKGGMKFDAAAKKYSTDTGSKTSGGSLGDIEYTSTSYDKDFMAGAMLTKTGTVSSPIKSQFGYHLIKVNSRKEYKEKPLSAVQADIKSTLLNTKKSDLWSTTFTTWKKQAKITDHKDRIDQ